LWHLSAFLSILKFARDPRETGTFAKFARRARTVILGGKQGEARGLGKLDGNRRNPCERMMAYEHVNIITY
jgi:hypothetical protein